jgi:hypothetical protein
MKELRYSGKALITVTVDGITHGMGYASLYDKAQTTRVKEAYGNLPGSRMTRCDLVYNKTDSTITGEDLSKINCIMCLSSCGVEV